MTDPDAQSEISGTAAAIHWRETADALAQICDEHQVALPPSAFLRLVDAGDAFRREQDAVDASARSQLRQLLRVVAPQVP